LPGPRALRQLSRSANGLSNTRWLQVVLRRQFNRTADR